MVSGFECFFNRYPFPRRCW